MRPRRCYWSFSLGNSAHFSFKISEAIPNIPVTIFTLSEEANPEGFARAWGAGFVMSGIHHVGEPRRQGPARPQPQEAERMSASRIAVVPVGATELRPGFGSRPVRFPNPGLREPTECERGSGARGGL